MKSNEVKVPDCNCKNMEINLVRTLTIQVVYMNQHIAFYILYFQEVLALKRLFRA